METITIVLADDHQLVRAGISSLLGQISGVQVVGEAGDGREALELILQHKPAIAILDIAMPSLNGLEVTRRAVGELPHLKVILLSMHSTEEYVFQSLHSGASGYLLKDSATVELELAIRAVVKGDKYLSPAVSKRVVDRIREQPEKVGSPLDQLTTRQRDILQLIAEGHTVKEIASMLDLSNKTVEVHKMQLMERLEIHDIPGLVRFAIRYGVIGSE